jgi:hypothetical protein
MSIKHNETTVITTHKIKRSAYFTHTLFFPVALTAQIGPHRLFVEVSILHTPRHTHTHTHQVDSSERVISPSQGPLPTQHTTNTTDEIHALGGIRTRDPSNRASADLRFRLHAHRDRLHTHTHTHTHTHARARAHICIFFVSLSTAL